MRILRPEHEDDNENGLQEEIDNITLGKKTPIKVKEIIYIDKFKEDICKDIKHIEELINQLDKFSVKIEEEITKKDNYISEDVKLERLIRKNNK